MTQFRLTLLLGSATAATRILGFVRDILLAAVFGAGPVADAFFIALRIPNLMRRLTGEGGWTAGYVPIAMKLAVQGDRLREESFIRDSFYYVGIFSIILVILAELFASHLIEALAPGLDQIRFGLAVLYFRASLPLICGAALTSLLAAILISQNRFSLQAIVPVFVNMVLVLLLIYFKSHSGYEDETVGLILCWAASAITFLQAFILAGPAAARLTHPLISWPILSPDVRAMFAFAIPGLFIQFGPQCAVLLILNKASAFPAAISHLTYADRLAQLPFGFIASGLATIALPEFSEHVGTKDRAALYHSIDRAILFSLALALPAMFALISLAEPIISVLFERGAFGTGDRVGTAAALAGFAFGLPFAALARVQTQIYFACQRVKIPLLSMGLSVIVTGLAVQSPFIADTPFGLALAVSLGQCSAMIISTAGIGRLTGWKPETEFLKRGFKIVLATGLLALLLYWVREPVSPLLITGEGEALRWIILALICLGGVGFYGIILHFLGLTRAFRLSKG